MLDTLLVCVSEDQQVNEAVDAPVENKTLKANPEFMRNLKDAHDQYDTVKKQKFYKSMRRKKLDIQNSPKENDQSEVGKTTKNYLFNQGVWKFEALC